MSETKQDTDVEAECMFQQGANYMFGIRGVEKDEDLAYFYLFVSARLGHEISRGVCGRDDLTLRRAKLGLYRRVLLPGDLKRNRLRGSGNGSGSSLSRSFFGSSIFDGNVLPLVCGYLTGDGCDMGWRFPDPPKRHAILRAINLPDKDVHSIPAWGMRINDISLVDLSRNARFHDLTPLLFAPKIKGPFLLELTSVSDLRPLAAMDTSSIDNLDLMSSRVSDLSPLRDMDTSSLNCLCLGTHVNSRLLGLLRTDALRELYHQPSALYDLSGLIGMNSSDLRSLELQNTFISDLSPLLELDLRRLRFLDISGTQVSDLTPLVKMKLPKLWELDVQRTPASDLSECPPEWLIGSLPRGCRIAWRESDEHCFVVP